MCVWSGEGGGMGKGGEEDYHINNGTISDLYICSTTSAQSDYGLMYSLTWYFNSSICDNHLSTAIYKYTTKY